MGKFWPCLTVMSVAARTRERYESADVEELGVPFKHAHEQPPRSGPVSNGAALRHRAQVRFRKIHASSRPPASGSIFYRRAASTEPPVFDRVARAFLVADLSGSPDEHGSQKGASAQSVGSTLQADEPSSSSRALAALRSGVSKPSVNHW